MPRRSSNASLYSLLGSVAVHGLAALWCLTPREPVRSVPQLVQTVEFTWFSPTAPGAAAAAAVDAHEPEPVPTDLSARRAASASRSDGREMAQEASALAASTHSAGQRAQDVTEAASAPVEAASARIEAASARIEAVSAPVEAAHATAAAEASAPAQARPAPRAVDLSPLAAALTLRAALGSRGRCEVLADAAASCVGTAADAGANAGAAGDVRAELAGLGKELQLTPARDGSYSFDGPSFHATVARDGRVSFHDKIQDLNTFVEHHLVGVQINTSEKRRFMESTAELRERLAVAAEAQNQRRALPALREALRRVLERQEGSLAQKRRALFELWDDCAGDRAGREAQAMIEAFIREQLPEGSALAYSVPELAQLNRGRLSRQPFDPYAKPDAGVRPG